MKSDKLFLQHILDMIGRVEDIPEFAISRMIP